MQTPDENQLEEHAEALKQEAKPNFLELAAFLYERFESSKRPDSE